jgi:predicted nucleic-acid-binding protein
VIGVDTNVLLRYVLEDDGRQTPRATRFLEDDARLSDPVLLNPVLLVELVWTLARKEGFEKPDILAILDELADSPRVAFVPSRPIEAAVEAWRRGRADFADGLIAALNAEAGARTTVTFDKIAAAEPGFSAVP